MRRSAAKSSLRWSTATTGYSELLDLFKLTTAPLILPYSSSASASLSSSRPHSPAACSAVVQAPKSSAVGYTIATSESPPAGKACSAQMDVVVLSFKIKLTDCAESGVACHLALNKSLDLVFFLLWVLNAVKHEFSLLESFGVTAHLFDDLERILLVLFVVALVI